jgi:hypothetical protein
MGLKTPFLSKNLNDLNDHSPPVNIRIEFSIDIATIVLSEKSDLLEVVMSMLSAFALHCLSLQTEKTVLRKKIRLLRTKILILRKKIRLLQE